VQEHVELRSTGQPLRRASLAQGRLKAAAVPTWSIVISRGSALIPYDVRMRHRLRFLWNATRGHRLTPWRSPYLLWRIETYTGVKMKEIGFLEFWEFMWRERRELWRFLSWTGEMERWVHPKPKSS
jgi:hypothetical protein